MAHKELININNPFLHLVIIILQIFFGGLSYTFSVIYYYFSYLLLFQYVQINICLYVFTTAGVRQLEDHLSSTLFNIYVNDFPLYINEDKIIDANLEYNEINYLLFADDIVLIADTENDLKSLIDKAFRWSKD